MGKYKKNPRYNVLSIRVTDDEKAVLHEMAQHSRKSTSALMREAITFYASTMYVSANRG
ncbi:MAG: CopG family transcriptional regulator [Desulfuromonadales bacterium]|nr:CopG family transcriptional regulator [Desulfuromonadales bacterium]